jgi:hypothetical protein
MKRRVKSRTKFENSPRSRAERGRKVNRKMATWEEHEKEHDTATWVSTISTGDVTGRGTAFAVRCTAAQGRQTRCVWSANGSTLMRSANRHILEALALARELIILAGDGEAASEDDGCVGLPGRRRAGGYSRLPEAPASRLQPGAAVCAGAAPSAVLPAMRARRIAPRTRPGTVPPTSASVPPGSSVSSASEPCCPRIRPVESRCSFCGSQGYWS